MALAYSCIFTASCDCSNGSMASKSWQERHVAESLPRICCHTISANSCRCASYFSGVSILPVTNSW
ncbi:Uncharacterised protein [Vibrio cholerae]|nr:Uncharacterised protein [Vibrio cholerae]